MPSTSTATGSEPASCSVSGCIVTSATVAVIDVADGTLNSSTCAAGLAAATT